MKIDASLTFEKIAQDKECDAHLVVTLTAPALAAQARRPRICVIPVIDVSPSMFMYDGAKIAYAKKSVEKLIDHLGPGDYCGLVRFSGIAEVIHRPVEITAESKNELKRSVAELKQGNATNIGDALLVGLDLGNKMDLAGEVITRVILFTDGQTNYGVAKTPDAIFKVLEANLGICSLSAFSYGADADQDLLGGLAKKGLGNYAYVQNPDHALTAFGKELGGLLSTYATNLDLGITACADHEFSEVVSDVDSEQEKIGEGVRIKIRDILAEETRHIVIAVKIKAQKAVLPRPVNLFEVKAGYDILGEDQKKQRLTLEAKAKAQFVKAGEEQTTPNAELDKIVSLAEVVRAQIEAEAHARKGDHQVAVQRMNATVDGLRRRGQMGAAHLASAVGSRLTSENYQSNGGYLRSISLGMSRGMSVGSYEIHAISDLGDAGIQLSNSLQTSTSAAFAGGDAAVVPVPATPIGTVSSTGVLNPLPAVPAQPLPPTDDDKKKDAKKSSRHLSKKSHSW